MASPDDYTYSESTPFPSYTASQIAWPLPPTSASQPASHPTGTAAHPTGAHSTGMHPTGAQSTGVHPTRPQHETGMSTGSQSKLATARTSSTTSAAAAAPSSSTLRRTPMLKRATSPLPLSLNTSYQSQSTPCHDPALFSTSLLNWSQIPSTSALPASFALDPATAAAVASLTPSSAPVGLDSFQTALHVPSAETALHVASAEYPLEGDLHHSTLTSAIPLASPAYVPLMSDDNGPRVIPEGNAVPVMSDGTAVPVMSEGNAIAAQTMNMSMAMDPGVLSLNTLPPQLPLGWHMHSGVPFNYQEWQHAIANQQLQSQSAHAAQPASHQHYQGVQQRSPQQQQQQQQMHQSPQQQQQQLLSDAQNMTEAGFRCAGSPSLSHNSGSDGSDGSFVLVDAIFDPERTLHPRTSSHSSSERSVNELLDSDSNQVIEGRDQYPTHSRNLANSNAKSTRDLHSQRGVRHHNLHGLAVSPQQNLGNPVGSLEQALQDSTLPEYAMHNALLEHAAHEAYQPQHALHGASPETDVGRLPMSGGVILDVHRAHASSTSSTTSSSGASSYDRCSALEVAHSVSSGASVLDGAHSVSSAAGSPTTHSASGISEMARLSTDEIWYDLDRSSPPQSATRFTHPQMPNETSSTVAMTAAASARPVAFSSSSIQRSPTSPTARRSGNGLSSSCSSTGSHVGSRKTTASMTKLATSPNKMSSSGTVARRIPQVHKPEPEKKVGRRKGPLRPDQRKQASEIRKLGACLRCRFLKKTCDKNERCTGCQPSHARLWMVPCTRIDIKDLNYFMKDWKADYERHVSLGFSIGNIKGFGDRETTLFITHGYGHYLPVTAREVHVRDSDVFGVDWVEMRAGTPNEHSVNTARLSAGSDGISAALLADYIDRHIDGPFEAFVDEYFEGTPFTTEILKTAYRYWHRTQTPILRKALQLVLAYCLTQAICLMRLVPGPDSPLEPGADPAASVDGHIDDPDSYYQGSHAAPVMINFQVKCALADLWRQRQRDVLEELSTLFSSIYSRDKLKHWPTIFMLATVLLAIWELMQFDCHYKVPDPTVVDKFCTDMESTPVGVIVGLFAAISQKVPAFNEWDTGRHHALLGSDASVCAAMEEVRTHVESHESYLRARAQQAVFDRNDFDSLSNKFVSKLVIRAH